MPRAFTRLPWIALACPVLAASLVAQNILVVEHRGKPAIVRAVHGHSPYVEDGGKLVYAASDRFALKQVDEFFPVFVAVRRLQVKTSWVELVDQGAQINNQFEFHADFDSAYPLDDVFVVLYLTHERGNKSIFLQEVGRLEPNKDRYVSINVPLHEKLGRSRYEFHIFTAGLEVFNSEQPFAFREAMLDRMIAHRMADRPDGPPAFFVGPPPEYPAGLRKTKAEGKVVLRIRVLPTGAVTDPEILTASDPAFGESAIAAVRQWRFLPRKKSGRAVTATADLPINFVPPD